MFWCSNNGCQYKGNDLWQLLLHRKVEHEEFTKCTKGPGDPVNHIPPNFKRTIKLPQNCKVSNNIENGVTSVQVVQE